MSADHFTFTPPASEGPARFLDQAARHLRFLDDAVDQRDFIDDSLAHIRSMLRRGTIPAFDASDVITILDGWKAEIAERVAA